MGRCPQIRRLPGDDLGRCFHFGSWLFTGGRRSLTTGLGTIDGGVTPLPNRWQSQRQYQQPSIPVHGYCPLSIHPGKPEELFRFCTPAQEASSRRMKIFSLTPKKRPPVTRGQTAGIASLLPESLDKELRCARKQGPPCTQPAGAGCGPEPRAPLPAFLGPKIVDRPIRFGNRPHSEKVTFFTHFGRDWRWHIHEGTLSGFPHNGTREFVSDTISRRPHDLITQRPEFLTSRGAFCYV